MKITNTLIDEVKPYEDNPRLNESAIEKVAASLKEFGWQQPIVIDTNNVIVAGHTRWLAAKSNGESKVPTVVANKLTPEQIKAYRIADNRIGSEASFDLELLTAELVGLKAEDYDLLLMGFDQSEIVNMLTAAEPPEPPKEFQGVDEDIETEFTCPSCNYKWSGQPSYDKD